MQAELKRRARSEPLDDLPGSQNFFARVGPSEIEIKPLGVDLGEELAPTGEGFKIEALIFLQPMHGFDAAVVGVGGDRDADGLAVTEGFGEVTLEIAAVVGLPHQIAREDPAAIQVTLYPRGEDGAGRDTALLSEGPK
jgi:hypothetical protein